MNKLWLPIAFFRFLPRFLPYVILYVALLTVIDCLRINENLPAWLRHFMIANRGAVTAFFLAVCPGLLVIIAMRIANPSPASLFSSQTALAVFLIIIPTLSIIYLINLFTAASHFSVDLIGPLALLLTVEMFGLAVAGILSGTDLRAAFLRLPQTSSPLAWRLILGVIIIVAITMSFIGWLAARLVKAPESISGSSGIRQLDELLTPMGQSMATFLIVGILVTLALLSGYAGFTCEHLRQKLNRGTD